MSQPNLWDTINAIFKDSKVRHKLTLFSKQEIESLEILYKNEKPYLVCFVTGRQRLAKPEEIVRQLFAKKLMVEYGYPQDRIQIEKEVWFGSGVHGKRADVVVLHKDLEHPYIIVEVKKHNRTDVIKQLK